MRRTELAQSLVERLQGLQEVRGLGSGQLVGRCSVLQDVEEQLVAGLAGGVGLQEDG